MPNKPHNLRLKPTLNSDRNASGLSLYYPVIKRFIDFFFAIIGLLLSAPILFIVAALVKLNSPGPVFYRGIRTGKEGIPFRIFKFRTMVANAEALGGPSTAFNDPRLTRTGKFLRKYKLDELPQLINILQGEMSFVGPRPQVEEYTKLYDEKETLILSVKPGLTDYASLKFIHLDEILGDENVDDKYQTEVEPEKNRLRLKYVREQSLSTDFKIILKTIVMMFKTSLSWNTRN
jgi:lipopolysaccharide/colanic/teichoic acid biosynthesis glycosyltransferase